MSVSEMISRMRKFACEDAQLNRKYAQYECAVMGER